MILTEKAIIYLRKQMGFAAHQNGYEPDELVVTPEMVQAGERRLADIGEASPAYLAEEAFRAMTEAIRSYVRVQ
jgi:hypothetical protein